MYYEIWYNGKKVRVENEDKGATSMVYELQNLTSFKEYRILVLACTVFCSGNSNELNETTKVGVPGVIAQPTHKEHDSDLQINWAKPELLGGYIDYYELQIREAKSDKDFKIKIVQILSNYTSCSMMSSICEPDVDSYKYEFLVRAVNIKPTPHAGFWGLPHVNKFDEEGLKTKMQGDGYKSQKSNTVWQPDPQIPIKCVEESSEDWKHILERNKFAEHLHGEWSKPLVHWCHYSVGGYKIFMLAFFAVSVTICVVFVVFSMFRKYKRMKDITIILPAGLEDIMKEDVKMGFSMDIEMQKKRERIERIKSITSECIAEELLRTRLEAKSSSDSASENVGSQRQHSEEIEFQEVSVVKVNSKNSVITQCFSSSECTQTFHHTSGYRSENRNDYTNLHRRVRRCSDVIARIT
jgi:uncharacterized membrane protein